MSLTQGQLERYKRNTMLDSFGEEGQKKLLNSKILIIGIGGLGSSVAYYLGAAGIGTIGIIDGDKVELSNLQRQIIHRTSDVKKFKVLSAKEKIEQLNPEVKVITFNKKVTQENISEIIKDYDFIVSCTDNFPSKFLINDACVLNKKPYSHGGVLRFSGQTFTYKPGCACYRCIFDMPMPDDKIINPSEEGILGSVAGMLGTIQATEAIKYILNTGELLVNRLLIFDGLKMEIRTVTFNKKSKCPVCDENSQIKLGGTPIIN